MVRATRILSSFAAASLALTALFVVVVAPASALTVLIDFEDFDGTPAVGWNMIDSTDSGSVVDLLDITGLDSGIDLQMPTVLDNNGAFDAWNDANPLPAWAPDAAADDYVYFTTPVTWFFFTGLDPSRTYDFDLIVSRDLARSQDHRFIDDVGNHDLFDWDSQADGYLNGNTLSWTDLVPTSAGDITLGIRRDDASAMMNAIRITSVDEPPLSLLLALPVLLLLRRTVGAGWYLAGVHARE